jgi:hypothetical protein
MRSPLDMRRKPRSSDEAKRGLRRMSQLCVSALLMLLAAGRAAVVDRVAVVVGNQVFTESEVNEEVRLTEFLNQQPLDLSPQQRRAAAERLVDQQLLRNEMQMSNFPAPAPESADGLLREFQREHYGSEAGLRAALAKYGLTEDELKQHLLWQVTLLRFTDVRFGAGLAPPGQPGANRTAAGSAPEDNAIDERMDTWLKQARTQTRVQFIPEAFQ